MKPQDVIFLVIFVSLLLIRRPKLFVIAGLGALVLAIPLFASWIFFTAERLTWYAAVLFLTYIVISTFFKRTVQ